MSEAERPVRVWTGLDQLQAKILEQLLVDEGIECKLVSCNVSAYYGQVWEHSLWVLEPDEVRARELLVQGEEQMSEALDDGEEIVGTNPSED